MRPRRWRWRLRGRGRPPKARVIRAAAHVFRFTPLGPDGSPLAREPIILRPDEFEALRLVYLEGYTQEAAAERMRVSRGTLWRALSSGRRKLVQALAEGRPIVLE